MEGVPEAVGRRSAPRGTWLALLVICLVGPTSVAVVAARSFRDTRINAALVEIRGTHGAIQEALRQAGHGDDAQATTSPDWGQQSARLRMYVKGDELKPVWWESEACQRDAAVGRWTAAALRPYVAVFRGDLAEAQAAIEDYRALPIQTAAPGEVQRTTGDMVAQVQRLLDWAEVERFQDDPEALRAWLRLDLRANEEGP